MPCPTPFGTSELIYSHLATTEDCGAYIFRDFWCLFMFVSGSLSIWCQWWHDDKSETNTREQIILYIGFILWIPAFEFVSAFMLICLLVCYLPLAPLYYAIQEDKRRSNRTIPGDPAAVLPLMQDNVPVRTIVDSTRITSYDIDNPVAGRPPQNQP